MSHKSIAKFSICQCICAEVAAICIFWIYAWALTRQRRICTVVLLFDIWSKYDNFTYLMTYSGFVNKFAQHVYFLANLKYANELLKHMSRGFICTCPPCMALFWPSIIQWQPRRQVKGRCIYRAQFRIITLSRALIKICTFQKYSSCRLNCSCIAPKAIQYTLIYSIQVLQFFLVE